MNSFLKLENATFAHAQKTFFQQFSWTLQTGQNWIITGPIGSGKTSLVQALSGKYFLKKGTLSYPQLEAESAPNRLTFEERKRAIKVVSFKDDSRVFDPHSFFYSQRFNSFAADGTVTVWEYLMESGFSEYEKEHVDLIKRTGVFELLDRERIKLSSGQSRKLLITKAILQKPRLLIIDNPYMGLDGASRVVFNELLDQLVQEEGIQLILAGQYDVLPNCISHELALDNFQKMYEGPLREQPSATIHQPKQPTYGKHLTLLSPEELANEKAAFLKKEQTVLLKEIKSYFEKPSHSGHWTHIFSLKNTSVAYFGKKVLDNINWTVQPGEKWVLFGKNGSGKSTLLSLLFGDHPQAYANEIYLFDQKRGVGQNIWDIKKRTGFTSSELHYFFNAKLTAEEAIITGLFDHVYLKRKPTAAEQQLVDLLLAYFNLTHLKSRYFQQLSTGEQRIVLLIRALIKNPPLILLDEPFQGFDLATIESAKLLLETILSDQHTLVFITHYEREIPENVAMRFDL
ncbi:MAG: ATP-binding cassette domain-containing protein [Bacteroidota bacterium]